MVKKLVFLLLAASLLFSCQSNKAIKRASKDGFMYAMIYDYDGTPVAGVAVHLNGRKTAESDVQGRFVLDRTNRGEYSVRLAKKGYETLEEKFHFDPTQVLYFKMIDAERLVNLAETALDGGDPSVAQDFLDRALALEPDRPDILYLKSITLHFQGKNDEAVKTLEGLLKRGIARDAVIGLLETVQKARGG